MDKEEYRQEVIKQLKKQNDLLDCIVVLSFIILLLVFVIMCIEFVNMKELTSIGVDTEFIKDYIPDIKFSVSNIENDVNVWLQDICDYAIKIYAHIKY